MWKQRACSVLFPPFSIMSMQPVPTTLSPAAGAELKRRLRPLLARMTEPGTDTCAWLDGLTLHQDGERLRVLFPHSYFAAWFAAHKRAVFESALRRHFGDMMPEVSYEVSYAVAGVAPAGHAAHSPADARPEDAGAPAVSYDSDAMPGPLWPSEARNQAESGFAAFIVNARNAFPLAAARIVAGLADARDEHSRADAVQAERAATDAGSAQRTLPGPGQTGAQGLDTCRVFVLCGKSGTGKTHLLRAISAALAAHSGADRVVSGSAARFCAEAGLWRDHASAESAHFWADRFWAGCEALVLDDLQELADDSRRQALLAACMDACPGQEAAPWHTASGHNAAQESAAAASSRATAVRRMIFAHAGPAAELRHLDERLRSRLESGLVLELLEPDLDVRLRYLQREARARGLELARDQLLYLAQRCTQFSLLQGLLHKVAAFAALNGRPPRQADLENIVSTGGSVRPSGCRDILGSVARGFNLRPEDLLGARRRPDHVLARQVAMYLCRRKLGLSYPELGRAFGGRDHSTVIHAVKKIRRLLETDKGMHTLVTELENAVP